MPIITLPVPGAWAVAPVVVPVPVVLPTAVVPVPVALLADVLPVLLAALPVPGALPVDVLPVFLAALPVPVALLADVLPVLLVALLVFRAAALPVFPVAALPVPGTVPVFLAALPGASAESCVAPVWPATPPAMLGGGTACSDCPLADRALVAGSCPCRSAHPDTHAQSPNIPTHAHRLPIQSPRVPIPRYVPGDLCKRRAPID
ncbi:hypothetical protein FJV41_14105 [Myxococcus llanfairpwllgwyngyllgogerychwyrndrobwllllantysiliogogogochensis]|uniref:Uncharacterized protein n=1 Tax=Myxococcus llanfairpwllgwyngyllgogerychwyrndrobwllllantysiliogogogochensis TaxID=2590453 RepID=A0A540X226_9BACT|nr:hypothetical protein [Myxococcus llanfairpwllgwyngyllgogerychwyrndrobwllllantysiliogogogochensis]TQF15298.1 hypothetical protein FJV41_14105 [Myxococcus llanfairpwllgwyngyllgogerychwyrndrobwllllantysiliogogogochensis]